MSTSSSGGSADVIAAIDGAVRGRSSRVVRNEIVFLCLAHDDHHPSARWHPKTHVWCCDVCGAGGGWTDLADRLGIDRSSHEGLTIKQPGGQEENNGGVRGAVAKR